ncbi:MAG TPA: hypothetical protein VLL52_19580 [Anaerolineae bacterium]|nr:hypothetical protein [Anaerolineae bacterium]
MDRGRWLLRGAWLVMCLLAIYIGLGWGDPFVVDGGEEMVVGWRGGEEMVVDGVVGEVMWIEGVGAVGVGEQVWLRGDGGVYGLVWEDGLGRRSILGVVDWGGVYGGGLETVWGPWPHVRGEGNEIRVLVTAEGWEGWVNREFWGEWGGGEMVRVGVWQRDEGEIVVGWGGIGG